MTSYDRTYRPIDNSKGLSESQISTFVKEQILRLYDYTIDISALKPELHDSYFAKITGLGIEDKLALYRYLKKSSIIYGMVGNGQEKNRYSNASDYLYLRFIEGYQAPEDLDHIVIRLSIKERFYLLRCFQDLAEESRREGNNIESDYYSQLADKLLWNHIIGK